MSWRWNAIWGFPSVEDVTGMKKDRMQAARFQLSLIFHDQPERERQRIVSRISRTTIPGERADLMSELLDEQARVHQELEAVNARIQALQLVMTTSKVNDRKAMDAPPAE